MPTAFGTAAAAAATTTTTTIGLLLMAYGERLSGRITAKLGPYENIDSCSLQQSQRVTCITLQYYRLTQGSLKLDSR